MDTQKEDKPIYISQHHTMHLHLYCTFIQDGECGQNMLQGD